MPRAQEEAWLPPSQRRRRENRIDRLGRGPYTAYSASCQPSDPGLQPEPESAMTLLALVLERNSRFTTVVLANPDLADKVRVVSRPRRTPA